MMGAVDSVARLLALSAGNGGSEPGETLSYNDLENKPQINGTTLTGNKTLDELGITAGNLNVYTKEETISAINNVADDKADKTALGNLSDLATDDKSSAVAAINEIKKRGAKASNIDNLTITENENGEIQAVGVLNDKDKETLVKLWTGTKAEYDAIEEKDDATLYNITDDYEEPEIVANKTTIIDANSTDTQYPSAKAVYDIVQNSPGAALDNIVPKQTATDSIINVNDALKYKAFDFKVDGAYKQTTSDGSNLLNIDYSINPILGERGDIQASLNDDYSFTITGNKTDAEWSNIYFDLLTDINIKAGTQYYVHSTTLVLLDSELQYIKNMSGDFIADADYIVKRVYYTSNKQGDINEVIHPYLGTVPYDESKYYKYTGGNPSPNPDYPQGITTLDFDKIAKNGQNLFNYQDTKEINNAYSVDEDGWINISIDNTDGSKSVYYNYYTNNIHLKPNTNYNVFLEVKSVTGNAGISVVSRWSPSQGQFSTGFEKKFTDLQSGKIYNKICTTLSDFSLVEVSVRTFCSFNPGESGSIIFRVSVIEDTSVTPDTFTYQPYKETNYQIDLQDNELVSLPNGVKDELTIDKEGNVNLIKNVGKKVIEEDDIDSFNTEWYTLLNYVNLKKPENYIGYETYDLNYSYNNITMDRFYQSPDYTPRETYDKIYSFNPFQGQYMIGLMFSKNTTLDDVKPLIIGTTMYYQLKEPQTINLGKLSDIITTEQGANTFAINGNISTNISTTYALDIKKYIDNKIAAISSAVLEQE